MEYLSAITVFLMEDVPKRRTLANPRQKGSLHAFGHRFFTRSAVLQLGLKGESDG